MALACAHRPPIAAGSGAPPSSTTRAGNAEAGSGAPPSATAGVPEATSDGDYVLRGAGLELVVSPAFGHATRLSARGRALLVTAFGSPPALVPYLARTEGRAIVLRHPSAGLTLRYELDIEQRAVLATQTLSAADDDAGPSALVYG